MSRNRESPDLDGVYPGTARSCTRRRTFGHGVAWELLQPCTLTQATEGLNDIAYWRPDQPWLEGHSANGAGPRPREPAVEHGQECPAEGPDAGLQRCALRVGSTASAV